MGRIEDHAGFGALHPSFVDLEPPLVTITQFVINVTHLPCRITT